MSDLRTVWRIRGIAGRAGLDVELVVDSSAAVVVEAIERAALAHGIALERVTQPRVIEPARRGSTRSRGGTGSSGKGTT